MSNRFEHIVRPFQTPQVTYPTRVFDTTQEPAEDVVKTFGQEGSTKAFSVSFESSVTTYKDEKTKEKSREVKKKRIENDEDPTQFVDVELIQKLTTERGGGSKWQKTISEFKNT